MMIIIVADGRWLCARQYFKQFTSVISLTPRLYEACVCVCVCARARVRACVCICLPGRGSAQPGRGANPPSPCPLTCFVSALKPSSW